MPWGGDGLQFHKLLGELAAEYAKVVQLNGELAAGREHNEEPASGFEKQFNDERVSGRVTFTEGPFTEV